MSRRLNLAAQHGYSMVAVMLVMLATSMLGAAAFAVVGGDIPFARASQDRKAAYAAAEAGLEYYLFQLARDNDYWSKCTTVPPVAAGVPAPINPEMKSDTPTPRLWRQVSGTTDARFSIELLPANGSDACSTASPETTMLDSKSGTFRIRSTGESRGVRRSIVATFRRSSFLDYLYFTDYETADPLTYTSSTDRTNAASQCVKYRASRATWCRNITFFGFDKIKGPLHTNDDLLTCGSPDFGVDKNDAIEISGPASDGWTQGSGSACSAGTPDFLGTVRWPAPSLAVPTSNNKLKTFALANGYVFYGKTTIVFNDATGKLDVTYYDKTTGVKKSDSLPPPPNGVIYVDENARLGGCTPAIDGPLEQDYAEGDGCAVAYVKGNYSTSMTIGSAADIVVSGDLLRVGDPVLGLVATNFVRVKHGVRGCPQPSYPDRCETFQNIKIQAAILTLQHSFIVDNYDQGAKLGTLTVDGAIAQKFRGPVGTGDPSTGAVVTGYAKDYNYDKRLRYRSPPFFLDPISAAWRIIRANEQVPAPKL
jgi:Tfp pilus assembly protein PilX